MRSSLSVCLSVREIPFDSIETAGRWTQRRRLTRVAPAETASDLPDVDICRCYCFQAPAGNSRRPSYAINHSRDLTKNQHQLFATA